LKTSEDKQISNSLSSFLQNNNNNIIWTRQQPSVSSLLRKKNFSRWNDKIYYPNSDNKNTFCM